MAQWLAIGLLPVEFSAGPPTTLLWQLDKLKGLGNTILGKFGMSLDNFKAVQDPATGSYSISFQR